MRPRTPLSVAVALAALALAAGCGSDDGDAEQRLDGPWGSLGGSVRLYRPTPEGAVVRYLAYLRAGGSARAMGQYVPPVLTDVGLRRMAVALERIGSYRALGRPRVKVTARRGRRVRAVAAIDYGPDEPVPYEFVLLRAPGGWRIAFDEITEESLVDWAELRAGGQQTESGAAAGRRAGAALRRASSRVLGSEGLR